MFLERPSPKIALVDMDGTLADYDKHMIQQLELLRSPTDPVYNVTPDDDATQPWLKARKTLISMQPGFWKNLPRLELGFKIVALLQRYGCDIQILSKAPASKPLAWMEKMEWCREHVPFAKITLTENKANTYGRILVDDYPPYALGWLNNRPRGLVLLPDQAWNQGFEHPRVFRVFDTPYSLVYAEQCIVAAVTRLDKEPLTLPR